MAPVACVWVGGRLPHCGMAMMFCFWGRSAEILGFPFIFLMLLTAQPGSTDMAWKGPLIWGHLPAWWFLKTGESCCGIVELSCTCGGGLTLGTTEVKRRELKRFLAVSVFAALILHRRVRPHTPREVAWEAFRILIASL